MDQLQAKLYKLLVEVDEICKRNSIVYYLAGGTALGAIRGGGFLPWDDDIDLYITRDNWNKLVKVMETQTPENRIFVCVENDDIYLNPVGRYVDKNTTVMMKSQLLCGKACGQLIEFFIMDPMPKGDEAKWRHRQLVKTYAELLSPYFVTGKNILTDNKDYDCELYKKYYKKSQKVGMKKVLKEILDEITSVEEKDSDCYCMRWGIRTLMYGKDLLAEPRMEKFEDAMFPIPAKQEEVARIAYGDSWMYVPEGTAKVVHNLDKDLTTPFETYTDLYMPLLDKETLLKNYEKNKRIRADALYRKNTFKMEFAKARAKVAAKYITENDYNVNAMRKLLDERNFEELKKHLDYFYSQQSHSEIKTNRILVPVSDEYIYIAIMYHVLKGAYYKANGILAFRKETEKPLTEDLASAEALINFCKKVSVAVFDKRDVAMTEQILKENTEYKDVVADYARAELWCMTQNAETDEDYHKIIQYAREKAEEFGNDGEIIRFEAYALYQLKSEKESFDRYIEAVHNTRNGYVWKEAGELFHIDAYNMVDNNVEDYCYEEELVSDKNEDDSKNNDGNDLEDEVDD